MRLCDQFLVLDDGDSVNWTFAQYDSTVNVAITSPLSSVVLNASPAMLARLIAAMATALASAGGETDPSDPPAD